MAKPPLGFGKTPGIAFDQVIPPIIAFGLVILPIGDTARFKQKKEPSERSITDGS